MSARATAAITPEAIAAAWREALALWDVSTTLSPPEPLSGRGQSHWQGNEPLAFIDLETRQVVVNFELLGAMGAASSLTAVLAHEIGHHVRFPHTLGLAATLQLLEKRLIPGLKQSLTNLFFDLLVNEHVGRTRAGELCAVYQGFLGQTKGEVSPLFGFYLAIYEELWGQDPGTLLPAATEVSLERDYPGFRADARMFVQSFYDLQDVHLQFVYFCSRFLRYVPEPEKLQYRIPMGGDVPAPDADDLDAAIRGNGSGQIDDALDEARERGWIDDSGLRDAEPAEDPLSVIDRITRHLPGNAQAELKLALVSKHYKRLVDEHVLKLPAVIPPPEPFLPSVLEEWEWGDNPRRIDWTGSVLAEGPLAALKPLARDLLPDEPSPLEQTLPAVEIYLDTSGSMPDPSASLNAMTLAAQILAASAIRKRGIVRGIVYSAGKPLLSEWMYDEERARRFLLHYVGGGTDYPFDLLRRLSDERGDVIRVIISDSDFLSNVQQHGAMEKLQYAVERSRALVAFLAASREWVQGILAPVMRNPRFRLALVESPDQFAKAAASLSDALLGA